MAPAYEFKNVHVQTKTIFFYRVHGYVSHKINVIDILKDIQLQRC